VAELTLEDNLDEEVYEEVLKYVQVTTELLDKLANDVENRMVRGLMLLTKNIFHLANATGYHRSMGNPG